MNFIKKQKWSLFVSLMIVAVILMTTLFGLLQMHQFNQSVIKLNSWISHYRNAFLLWHGLIMLAIYFYWGRYVEKQVIPKIRDAKEVKKILRFRWWVILSIVLIDLVTLYKGF